MLKNISKKVWRMDASIFKKLGFSDKHTAVYLALVYFGPSSVRTLAEYCHLNRGTTYDALKWLKDQGLVDFYHKDSRQHFVAESPDKLYALVEAQTATLATAKHELARVVPELSALHRREGERPVARYLEREDLKSLLEDVLATSEAASEKLYRIYSAEGVRKYLYENFPGFSDARVAKGIQVRVIALGDGGELRGLDERKWLNKKSATPTYIVLYPGKTASISLNTQGEPVGVVIENQGIFETQRAIFDHLWSVLP